MLTPLRRRLAPLALVLLLPGLGACAYQTDQVYQPGVGVNSRTGTVDVLGAVVVSSTDGRGTFVASLVNSNLEEPDQLTTMTGEGVQVQLSTPVEIQPESLVNLADSGLVSVTGDSIEPGSFVKLTLTFASGQETDLEVPVVDQAGEFSDVEAATPSPFAKP